MCDRNDGNIQHLTNCSGGETGVPSDDTFVSHPSDFVIECQTVDVEVCEQDGNNVNRDEEDSDTGKLSLSLQNQSTASAQSSETETIQDDETMQYSTKNSFGFTKDTITVTDAIVNNRCWPMDNMTTHPVLNEQNQLETSKNKELAKTDEPDKLVIDYTQSKSENEGDSDNKDISEKEVIEVVKHQCSETNGFLSEFISFHDKQEGKAQFVQSDKPQKRPRRAIKKVSKLLSTETNSTKNKRGAKKLKKNVKTARRRTTGLKNGSRKCTYSVTRIKAETGNSTETNEESTVEEVDDDKNACKNVIGDYVNTEVISGSCDSNNDPCPITYRHIINNITKDECCILEWCHKVGLIPAEVQCECGSWKEIQMAKDKPLGLIRKCPNCKMRTSVLKGTWFESSHLSIAQIIELTYMWIYRLPQTYVQHELSTSSHHTTGDWYLYCREVCAVILQKTSEKLGGDGKIVEVGETKVGKKKYNMGRLLEGQWILGGIERDTKKMFVVSVKDRDMNTFFSVVKEWVNPGTTVIAEYAKSYHFQNDERLRNFTTTHGINFIQASTSPHGQSMNNRWKQRDTGDCRKEFPNTYFLEYMYRVKYSNTDDLFLTFVNHLSLVYPGK